MYQVPIRRILLRVKIIRSKTQSSHRKILCLLYLLPLSILLLSLNGCTWIMIDHYFAPTTQDKREQPHRYTTCEITFFSTGPAETIKIDDEITLTVYQRGRGRKLSLISMGPLYFPVIPIFPVNWFKSESNEFLSLEFDIVAKNNVKVNWYVKDTILLTHDGNIVQPEAYWTPVMKTATPIDETTMVELRSPWEHYVLRYPVTAKTISTFHLSLKGFSTNEKLLALPMVEFRQASSWKMCGGP